MAEEEITRERAEEVEQILAEELPSIEERAAKADVIDLESSIFRALLDSRRCAIDVAAESMADASRLRSALETVNKVRPVNWDDDEDPDQTAAWRAVDAALAGDAPKPLQALIDEVDFWRGNAAAHLSTSLMFVDSVRNNERPAETPEDLAFALVFQFIRQQVGVLESALSGNTTEGCEHCGKPLRAGQIVISYEDVGDAHADCDNPWRAPQADPELAACFHTRDEIFTSERIAADAARGRAWLEAFMAEPAEPQQAEA